MDLTERAEIRKETFYKLTNSREVPAYPANGHRNLAQTNSSSWSNAYTNFNGGANSCASIGKVLTDGLQVGDTVKIRIVLKYTNVVSASGKTAKFWPQGSGNVTQWNSGSFFNTGGARNLNGSGEIVVEATDTVHPDHLKNAYWDCNIRFDYVASGSVQWKEFKVEIGKSFTPYSQAPEQMGWSKTAPVPTPDQRYLWKFEYIYYSDGTVEVTPPVNLSIAGGTVSHRETFYKLTNSATPPNTLKGNGQNLLRYSSVNADNLRRFNKSTVSVTNVVKDGHAVYKIVQSGSDNSGASFEGNAGYYNVIKDRLYTFSFKVLSAKDAPYNYNHFGHIQVVNDHGDIVGSDKVHQHTSPVYSTSTIKANVWTKVWCTFKATSTGYFKPFFWYLKAGEEFYIYDMMLNEGSTPLPYAVAPEDFGWSKDPLVPTQSNRYLWKFEFIYYTDGNVEVTDPVNSSIAGQNGATGPQGPKGEQGIAGATGPQGTRGPKGEDGKSTYIHIKYSPVERPNDSQISDTPNTYIGVYTDNIENDSNKASAYTWSKWQGRDGAQGVPGKPGADGKTTYVHFAYANSADGKTNFNTNYFAGALYVGTLTDHTATDSTNYAAYTWSRLKGEDGVIESNGENRIFYGRGDTKKGFFKNATIGTDWNGVPYGEFDEQGWHTTNASDRWIWVSTTDGMKLLGNSGNVPTGKWTMSQDFYITDTMTDTPILGNYLRFHKTDGSFFDPTAIVLDGRDPSLNSRRIPTNAGRRAIWNPEPDRVAYGGNPLINPLEVNINSCNQIKVSTKCVPDELGNGVSQYIIEPIGSQEKNMFDSADPNIKIGTPSAWAPYTNVSGNKDSWKDYYLVTIPKSAMKQSSSSSELYKVSIPISVDAVTPINSSAPATAEIHVRAWVSGAAKYDGAVMSGYSPQQYTLNANGTAGNYKLFKWDFRITKTLYDTLDNGNNISFFLRLQNVASCKFHMKDADCYYYQSNPWSGFYIPSVENAIPRDDNKTWSAMLKIRASRNVTIKDIGFERFQTLQNVTLKPEWQTMYFNGKASYSHGSFLFYGPGIYDISSKLVIEIAEVKICDENVSKDILKDTLLTRHWYRRSQTETLTDTQRVGLNGAISGAVSVWVPKGKKTNAKIRLRNVSLRHGDAEIPFAPAPEDIYDQNNSKVDQDQLDQIANELRDQQDRLAQELAAKALASEVSELTTQIKNLKESDLAGKADITKAVGALEKRLANVIPLGNMSQKLQFIDSYILQGEEGMEIGNKNSGSKVMITPDRIGFFSGGTEVASFSSGQLRINNGFFADTITVGHFMTRKHPNNQYVNGTYFVK